MLMGVREKIPYFRFSIKLMQVIVINRISTGNMSRVRLTCHK